jgi:hypothetical protein
VAAVVQATSTLLERVKAMDAEAGALVESLRTGAGRLAADLQAVEENMGELYDAAAGQRVTRAVAGEGAQPSAPTPPSPGPAPQAGAPRAAEPPLPPPSSGAAAPQARPAQSSPPPLSPSEGANPAVHLDPEAPMRAAEGGDLDSARLVALNMALNGESREDADRYLAENYRLADRGKLIEEVYAAIEG